MEQTNVVPMVLVFTAMALIPLFTIVTTCFLKIAVVLVIVRNALGVQQVPPTLAIYGIALSVSIFIMAPVFNEIKSSISVSNISVSGNSEELSELFSHLRPLKEFMDKYTDPNVKRALDSTTHLIWKDGGGLDLKDNIFMVIPSFVISEVQAGFKIGFLIYLPFLVVDILISNLLLAMGMQMVSPMSIAMPLKILLFVVADGWQRLIESLVLSYA